MAMDNVVIELDEESKEFQKLSLTTDPPRPQDRMNIDGRQLLVYLKNRPKVELILDDKPKQNSPTPSTCPPLSPPDFPDKWDYKVPTVEEYARLNRFFADRAMFSLPPQK